jgi:hypothetical protein
MMFDTDPSTQPLFETAAENLLAYFGAQALSVAGAAIEKMQALGHQEGVVMWRRIRREMLNRTPGGTLH